LTSALLALEDGTVFEGRSFGAPVERTGEVVFNTSITGYQEIFTDPSYSGQIVCLTAPQIGNYGATEADSESARPFIEGLCVRDFSPIASNWRSETSAQEFLTKADIPIISDIDTRALVLHLRSRGVMRGVLSTLTNDRAALIERAKQSPSMAGLDLATTVSTKTRYEWTSPVVGCSPSEDFGTPAEQKYHVVAYDFGIKRNILRRLAHVGCRLTVVPSSTTADEVLALKPHGVFLSNGPGDPEPLLAGPAIEIRKLIGKLPIFGICLGHQVLGLALGAKTFKLKFGHRGGNHPVLNKRTGHVEITAQNHGFAVDPDTLPSDCEVTHVNLNDETLEGFRHRSHPLFCVQHHPEAAPGPHDSLYLFDEFVQLMKG
jgi:carbamoyl-phosphate synthase small subunit